MKKLLCSILIMMAMLIMLGLEQPRNMSPIGTSRLTAEQYKAIRDKVPYTPLTKEFHESDLPAIHNINQTTMAQDIADTLTVLDIAGESFIDPKELPWDVVLSAATMATRAVVNSTNYDNDRYIYRQEPELDLIYQTVPNAADDGILYFEEHIEKSAKLLFGEDYHIVHASGGGYEYYPLQGVYSLLPRGFNQPTAAVLDYQVSADMVVAHVSYIRAWMDETWMLMTDDELDNHMRNEAPCALAVFGINDDGSLCILSHYMLYTT